MVVFKEIKSCPGYLVSDCGEVMSMKRSSKNILSQIMSKKGYRQVALYVDGKLKMAYVSRLVMEAFVGFPADPWLCVVNHKNGDLNDCRLENMEWVICETTSEYDPSISKRKGVLKPELTKERMTEAKLHQSEESLKRAAMTRRETCMRRKAGR